MALTFPTSPTVGQVVVLNSRSYQWTGKTWDLYSNVGVHKSTHATGGTDALTPADIGAPTAASPKFTGQAAFNTTAPATESAYARVAIVGLNLTSATLSSAFSLSESNSKAALTVRPNPFSGYTLHVGAFATTNSPYIQNAQYNGGTSSAPLHLNPFGGNVGVGLVTPAARLHVVAGTAGDTAAILQGPGNAGVYIDYGGTGYNYYDATQHTFRTTSGSRVMAILYDRFYAIGNDEPYALGSRYTPSGGTVYFGATNATSTPDAQISNSGGAALMTLQHGGNVGIGGATPAISSGTGLHCGGSTIRLGTSRTPASATATGNTGEICWDSGYLYVCVATNTWKRTSLSTW